MTSGPRAIVHGLLGLPEVAPGDDLPALVVDAARRARLELAPGDVFVIAQKIVSKAEGRLVRLADVAPSPLARRFAAENGKDARVIEVILAESSRVVRMERGVLITETPHGFVCANGGVDASNVAEGMVALLPRDPDASARRMREALVAAFARTLGVIVSDTFGRPWREGQVNVAIGVAGIVPLRDERGRRDGTGRVLSTTVLALADELAAAAGLVMAKAARIPVAVVQGLGIEPGDGTARVLVRPAERNLFP